MKTKIKATIIIAFLTTIFIVNQGQNQSSSNLVKKSIPIDSVDNISIDNVIYYSKPLELEYFALTDTNYIPKWYPAHCTNLNLFFFKDSLDKAINYISNDFAITQSDIQRMYNDLLSKGSLAEKYKEYQDHRFSYIFSEMMVTNRSNQKKYLITYGFYSDKRMSNLKFSDNIISKNIKNEKVDSIRKKSTQFIMSRDIYLIDYDTIKLIKQEKSFNELTLDNRLSLSTELDVFKNLIYKKQKYILSDVSDAKRVFKTMEKSGNSFKVKKTSNKPE